MYINNIYTIGNDFRMTILSPRQNQWKKITPYITFKKKGKRKVQGVPQSQTVALPRPQEEEETDKSKQAQIEQTYEKH